MIQKITLKFRNIFLYFALLICFNMSANEGFTKPILSYDDDNLVNESTPLSAHTSLNSDDIYLKTSVVAPDFTITTLNGSLRACQATGSIVYNFTYTTLEGFNENTVFSASGNPAGSTITFNPASRSTTGTFTMTVGNLGGAALGDYSIVVTGTSASITKTRTVVLLMRDTPCPSNGNSLQVTSTTGVRFNTISNLNTGKSAGGYGDFRNLVTEVTRAESYSMIVNANTGGFTTITYVWIDWNQNCLFDDAGEQFIPGFVSNSANGPTPEIFIVIPANATLGNTTMRVITKYIASDDPNPPTPCLLNFDGETEDYTINVLTQLGVDEFDTNSFSVIPNPNNGVFKLKLDGLSAENLMVTVYDLSGRIVYDRTFSNASELDQDIQLSNAKAGLYLVKVSNGTNQTVKKIMVK